MINRYRNPFRFYFFSAMIAWAFWFDAAYLSRLANAADYGLYISALGVIGLCCPLLVALYYLAKDKALLSDAASRLVNVGCYPLSYLLTTLLLMPTSIVLAMLLSLPLGYSVDQFMISGHASFSSGVLPVWFILVFAPVVEELAWHSYGTDCLRQKYSLFTTSMIFAVYWGLWHVPLAMIQGYYHSTLVIEGAWHSINFLLSLFPFVLLMNWLYYKTDRNILVAVVIHLSANMFNEVFATHPDSKIIQTGLLCVLTAYLLIKEKDFFFDRQYSVSPTPFAKSSFQFECRQEI